jgi:hypothetical protein
LDNPGKDPFLGHDAVTGLVIDGATSVTLLANLGDFQQSFADRQPGTYRKRRQVDPLRSYILGKVAGRDIKPERLHLGDALHGQQAHLSMPFAGMGITDNAVIFPQLDLIDRCFSLPFVQTYANRYHPG